MFICECGAVFDTPEDIAVDIGYHGMTEKVSVCPHCGLQNYDEAYTCCNCRAWIPARMVNGAPFCFDCERKLDEKIVKLLGGLTEDEKRYLEDRIGEYGVFYFTGEDEK